MEWIYTFIVQVLPILINVQMQKQLLFTVLKMRTATPFSQLVKSKAVLMLIQLMQCSLVNLIRKLLNYGLLRHLLKLKISKNKNR